MDKNQQQQLQEWEKHDTKMEAQQKDNIKIQQQMQAAYQAIDTTYQAIDTTNALQDWNYNNKQTDCYNNSKDIDALYSTHRINQNKFQKYNPLNQTLNYDNHPPYAQQQSKLDQQNSSLKKFQSAGKVKLTSTVTATNGKTKVNKKRANLKSQAGKQNQDISILPKVVFPQSKQGKLYRNVSNMLLAKLRQADQHQHVAKHNRVRTQQDEYFSQVKETQNNLDLQHHSVAELNSLRDIQKSQQIVAIKSQASPLSSYNTKDIGLMMQSISKQQERQVEERTRLQDRIAQMKIVIEQEKNRIHNSRVNCNAINAAINKKQIISKTLSQNAGLCVKKIQKVRSELRKMQAEREAMVRSASDVVGCMVQQRELIGMYQSIIEQLRVETRSQRREKNQLAKGVAVLSKVEKCLAFRWKTQEQSNHKLMSRIFSSLQRWR